MTNQAILARTTKKPKMVLLGNPLPIFDNLIPLECGALYQQAIPESELVVFDRCGYAPHLEKSDEFVAIAMQCLP